MHNVIILGSGRSGTSMAAGTLAKAGYFMGEKLYEPRECNPKGFFEDPEINGINEDLIAKVIPNRPPVLGRWFFRDRPIYGQRWLARVPMGKAFPSPPDIAERIKAATSRKPFCFKDPRFSYTLPVWRPYLEDTVYICVFRHPAATAKSILKECRDARYLHSLDIDFGRAVEVWTLMHRHILEVHGQEGRWLYVHFDQVLSEEGLKKIQEFTVAQVDFGFPEARLRRTVCEGEAPPEAMEIYRRLCGLAGHHDPCLDER